MTSFSNKSSAASSLAKFIFFDDEDGRLRPEFRVADGLDEPAERKVVVGDESRRCVLAKRGAISVVVGQSDDLQSRHVAFGLKPFQVGDITVYSLLIGVIQV